MFNKQRKKILISLVIRKMQNKTTRRYDFTLARFAKI